MAQVCECVMILKKLPDKTWATAKKMLGEINFLDSLINFEKDSIGERQSKDVQKYFKSADFNSEAMMSVSKAGAGLLKWVQAITT